MRIAKNTEILLSDAPTCRFLLVVDVMDGDVLLSREEKPLIALSLDGEDVLARLSYPDGRCATLFGANAKGKEVILTAGYARIGLYVGGVLLDEDHFFTPIDYKGAKVNAGSFMHFEAGYEYHATSESAIVENITDRLDGHSLTGTEYGTVRTMPVVVGERVSLLYLDERHAGCAKDGRGAHKVCAMFSEDGVHFHGAPIALGIDNVREDDLLDAALLYRDGRYYLYYLVKYATHKALSCAVSEDGFSFVKTGLDVEIPCVDVRKIGAIAVSDTPIPCLYFVSDGDVYAAESIDLLRFSAPKRLPISSAERVFPLVIREKQFLFVQKERKLFLKKGDELSFVCDDAASPVFYRGALRLFGTKDGRFTYRTAAFDF